uniref:Candidate secreted effector n=1 Tax=Meloidogyne incognita TaxID=6306 RepID=A0A914NR07_MELIC
MGGAGGSVKGVKILFFVLNTAVGRSIREGPFGRCFGCFGFLRILQPTHCLKQGIFKTIGGI